MITFGGRFNGRNLPKLYCNYAKLMKKPLSWELVFDQRISKPQAIKAFKQKLSESVESRKLSQIKSSQVKGALNVLIKESSILESNFEEAILSLYRLILQRRISDDEVYQAISRVSSKDVINVAVPPSSSKGVDHEQERPSLQIHAERKDHLGDVIKEIGNNDKPVTRTELFQDHSDKFKLPPSPSLHSHIDLGSLQEYLNKAEQGKKQKYSWETSRSYNWDNSLNSSPKLSAGDLIFAHKSKSPRRLVSRLLQRPMTNARHDSQIQKEPKDLLILNLERRSKIVIPASHTNSIFNINYRDLFGIINAPGRTPEEMLAAVNQLEAKGWQPIGDLYDNSGNVVFQRVVRGPKRINDGQVAYKIPIISIFIAFTVWGVYYFIELKNQSKEPNYHEHR